MIVTLTKAAAILEALAIAEASGKRFALVEFATGAVVELAFFPQLRTRADEAALAEAIQSARCSSTGVTPALLHGRGPPPLSPPPPPPNR